MMVRLLLKTFLPVIALLLLATPAALAQCTPGATNGADNITCEGTSAGVDARRGDDTIVNNGDAFGLVGGRGDDTIVNNGNALAITGNRGDDTIVNNGNALVVTGGRGDDAIDNFGLVGVVFGGRGDDLVSLYSDNQGQPLFADGDSINGTFGTSNDTLRFGQTIGNPVDYQSASDAIRNANPNGGSIVINGQRIVYRNFEQLLNALQKDYIEIPEFIVRDGRLNGSEAGWSSAVPYCNSGGLQLYAADGHLKVDATPAQIANALSQAVATGVNQTISFANGYGIYALQSNELQINGPGGYFYVFPPNSCGTFG